MSLFTIAVTVESPEGVRRDVVARAGGGQTVVDFAERLAGYLGLPVASESGQRIAYGLRVERTGRRLDHDCPLAEADLLEGDVLTLEPAPGPPGPVGRPTGDASLDI